MTLIFNVEPLIKVNVDQNDIQDPPKPVAFRSVGRYCLIDEPLDCPSHASRSALLEDPPRHDLHLRNINLYVQMQYSI